MQILAWNAVTQNTPDIHVSRVFRFAERTYGAYPVCALLNPFDKLESIIIFFLDKISISNLLIHYVTKYEFYSILLAF